MQEKRQDGWLGGVGRGRACNDYRRMQQQCTCQTGLGWGGVRARGIDWVAGEWAHMVATSRGPSSPAPAKQQAKLMAASA